VARLLGRKLALIVVLLPLLNAVGFFYAVRFAPNAIARQYGRIQRSETPSEPFLPRYQAYLQGVLAGDWGEVQNTPIPKMVATPLKNSLILLLIGFAVTVLLGPLLGLLAISQQTGRIGPRAQLLLTAGSAVPGFFLGSLLIALLLFISRSSLYPWRGPLLPVQGFGIDAHLVLPVLTLATRPVLYIANVTAGLIEHELQQEYVRVALSKGLRWRTALWRHAFPNIVASVTISAGQSLRMLISGLILAEALFDWRGLGRMFLSAIALDERGNRTLYFLEPQLLALILVCFGAILLLADLIASVIAHLADPRLREADRGPALA
jgi:ABC-type dipeptide/oligopeptide/nickel transport system permease component